MLPIARVGQAEDVLYIKYMLDIHSIDKCATQLQDYHYMYLCYEAETRRMGSWRLSKLDVKLRYFSYLSIK